MFYIGFDTNGNIQKVTNETDSTMQYMEIPLETYSDFVDYKKKIEDYIIIKKQDYVLVRRDGTDSTTTKNIFVVGNVYEKHDNSIYIIQNPIAKTFSITHTFEEDKFPPLQAYKMFYITDVNNSNKLLSTLKCSFEDFEKDIYHFDTEYFDNCKIITTPDMQSYYHYVGESID